MWISTHLCLSCMEYGLRKGGNLTPETAENKISLVPPFSVPSKNLSIGSPGDVVQLRSFTKPRGTT